MEPERIAEVLSRLKAEGKVGFFGVSNMQSHQIDYLQSCLDRPPWWWTRSRSVLANWIGWRRGYWLAILPARRQILRRARWDVAASIACRCGRWRSITQGQFSGRDLSQAAPNVQQTAELVRALAQRYQTSAEAIVLAWLLRHPASTAGDWHHSGRPAARLRPRHRRSIESGRLVPVVCRRSQQAPALTGHRFGRFPISSGCSALCAERRDPARRTGSKRPPAPRCRTGRPA